MPRFCSNCGAALVERASHTGDATRQHCPTCNTTIYDNPSVVVATLPVLEDRVVLIRRATQPGREKWAYPGGYLEVGETLEEGALRETKEETGLDVEITGLAGVYSRPGGRAITIAFEARAQNDRWSPGPEALEVAAFAADAIPWDELAFWTATYMLEDWLHARTHNLTPPRANRIGPARLDRQAAPLPLPLGEAGRRPEGPRGSGGVPQLQKTGEGESRRLRK